jgi:hypothetical protein
MDTGFLPSLVPVLTAVLALATALVPYLFKKVSMRLSLPQRLTLPISRTTS